jgi:uncharacterized Zn finger protein
MLKAILLEVIDVLNKCHVSGIEAKRYGEAIEALQNVVSILEKTEKKEEEHAD